ncbi:MAG: glycosyltransferase [Tissierella sp.]|nr:glycosyltransferase [Tissierella sp.]
MKVLHLISGGDTGGAKTHIISLMKGLNNLIDAKIICFIEDTFYTEVKDANIDIEVFEQKGRLDLSVIARLEEEINNNNYDIIHCHGARANFVAMFLKRKVKKPFITTIHSDYELDFKDNFYKRLIFTNLNKIALNKFDYYIAISDSFKDMLVDRGFKSEAIYTAYNGIDLDDEVTYISKDDFLKRHNIDARDKTIVGIIARLDLVKDHETFIKAADIVLKERKDVVFLIAGDGNDKKRLNSIVEELGIGEYIHFLGYVKDPYSFFNAIDINVLTSISESFPYVILEGARMNKTIISTKVGGVGMLIKDDYNGYIIDIGDSQSLAEKISNLLDDKEKIKIMGENLFKDVKENFSSEPMAKRHIEIYKEILNSVEGK